MRSSYWGQGGHNAILLVGDFFKSALDSGKLDANALFPGGHKAASVQKEEEPEQDMEDQPGELQQEGVPAPEPVQPPQPPEQDDEAPPAKTLPAPTQPEQPAIQLQNSDAGPGP
jgi:penicillin-binding protein 1A